MWTTKTLPGAGWVSALLLSAYCLFELLLALSAPLGKYAWGGQYTVLPSGLRVASGVADLVYACILVVPLSRSGIWPVIQNQKLLRACCVLLTVYFGIIGVIINLNSRSPNERWDSIPALIFGLCFLVPSRQRSTV